MVERSLSVREVLGSTGKLHKSGEKGCQLNVTTYLQIKMALFSVALTILLILGWHVKAKYLDCFFPKITFRDCSTYYVRALKTKSVKIVYCGILK